MGYRADMELSLIHIYGKLCGKLQLHAALRLPTAPKTFFHLGRSATTENREEQDYR